MKFPVGMIQQLRRQSVWCSEGALISGYSDNLY